MSHRVTLTSRDGLDATFECQPGRSLARAARNAGLLLTTGCLQGRCAICRARLLAGVVEPIRRRSPNASADPARRADGCVLLCSVGPASDVVLEPLCPWQRSA